MKAAKIVETVKGAGFKIDIRHYADGRYGFDVGGGKVKRRKIRAWTRKKAIEKAQERVGEGFGKLDVLGIDVKHFTEYMRRQAAKQSTVPAAVEKFMATKEGKGRSVKHMRDMRHTLDKFALAFPGPLDELTREEVEGWLNKAGVGPRRWNNLLAHVVSLFVFARKEGAIGAERTPVEMIDRKTVTVTVQTYTPDEMEALLKAVPAEWLPVIVLGAFAGIRPEEVAPERRNKKQGLRWENILWDKGKIDIPAEVSKIRRRRFVPLLEPAMAFLEPWRRASGPIAPSAGLHTFYSKEWTKDAKVKWKPDALRHSFASYRLAITHDMAALALDLGNSPTMIFRHYLDLKFEDEAQKWFAIRPK